MGKEKAVDHDEDKVELVNGKPGYEPEYDLYYNRKYKIGNTTGFIMAPKITREENFRRWQHVNEVASAIVKRMLERGVFDQDSREDEEEKRTAER